MTLQSHDANPGNVWRGQQTGIPALSMEDVRRRAERFRRKNRWDWLARSGFAVVSAVFCAIVVWQSGMTPLGGIAAIVMFMLLVNLGRISSDFSSTMAQSSCLEFYRDELARRRGLARQPAWQLLTVLLVIAWLVGRSPMRSGMNMLHLVQPLVLLAAAGVIILLAVRKYEDRRIQRDIDALQQFDNEDHG